MPSALNCGGLALGVEHGVAFGLDHQAFTALVEGCLASSWRDFSGFQVVTTSAPVPESVR